MKQNVFKSIISLLLTVSILFSLSASFFVYAESKSGYINDTNVQVRLSPTTTNGDNRLYVSGERVKLHTGHSVTVFDTVNGTHGDTYTWCNIEFTYGGKTYNGYVASQYVTIQKVSDDFVMPEGVPDIYKPYIEKLLSLHPNWNFVFYDTGYNWNDLFVTTNLGQCYTGRSLIQGAPLSYRSTASDCYNWREDKWIAHDGTSWYQANKETIAYYMDPRNFLNENTIFMFENLSFDVQTQNIDGVKNILKNSFMNEVTIKNQNNEDVLYAQAYMDAADYSKVSPYHLSSRTVQEVGYDGSGSTSGKYSGYEGYYNFYNIGASASTTPIANGLKFAKTGGSLSDANKAKCLIPWNTQYKSIVVLLLINCFHSQQYPSLTLYYIFQVQLYLIYLLSVHQCTSLMDQCYLLIFLQTRTDPVV
jgi:beta-N-acetylglucosaminidase